MEISLSREEKRKLKKKERKKKQRQQIACNHIQILAEEEFLEDHNEVKKDQEVTIDNISQQPKTVIEDAIQKSICENCNEKKVDYLCHDCKRFYCTDVFFCSLF